VRLGSGVVYGYMAQEQENLDPALTPYETIYQQTDLQRDRGARFPGQVPVHRRRCFCASPWGLLSYGERARLALACLVAAGCNFLLLDEPINHLDIPSRARFEQALKNFEGTVLAIVHDRYFIEAYASQVWEVRDEKIWQQGELAAPGSVPCGILWGSG
jgi:ATP-binding cassette, subfamily F, member 3